MKESQSLVAEWNVVCLLTCPALLWTVQVPVSKTKLISVGPLWKASTYARLWLHNN